MHQQLLFPDTTYDGEVTPLTETPTIAPAFAQRLRRAHIQVVRLTWNEWHQEWHFCIRGLFGIRGHVWELMKTAAGVAAMVIEMEQRKAR